jgi:hypothetical protein
MMYRIILYQLFSKKTLPVLLLLSTYLLGEAHHLFSSTETQNWIIFAYKPMTIPWNVKYLSEEVNRIIEAISFLLMLYMRKGAEELYILVLIEYLVYRILDIVAYFLNFKTESYWHVGISVGLIVAFIDLFIIKQKRKNEKKTTGSDIDYPLHYLKSTNKGQHKNTSR